MRIYPFKENPIGSAVQTDIHTSCYFIIRILKHIEILFLKKITNLLFQNFYYRLLNS